MFLRQDRLSSSWIGLQTRRITIRWPRLIPARHVALNTADLLHTLVDMCLLMKLHPLRGRSSGK